MALHWSEPQYFRLECGIINVAAAPNGDKNDQLDERNDEGDQVTAM